MLVDRAVVAEEDACLSISVAEIGHLKHILRRRVWYGDNRRLSRKTQESIDCKHMDLCTSDQEHVNVVLGYMSGADEQLEVILDRYCCRCRK